MDEINQRRVDDLISNKIMKSKLKCQYPKVVVFWGDGGLNDGSFFGAVQGLFNKYQHLRLSP